MPDVTDDILTPEQVLSEGQMLMEAPSAIGRIQVPKKGSLFESDGSCKIAIIRPCVSRGKRLRGLPPIYTPGMLAENASVFSGWLMYMDHLTERIIEMLQERGRSITELGGRVTKSWYDPELVFEDDEEFGYQKGGVVARAIPQPPIRKMLEADPGILHVSINAYPKGATAGVAPWNPALKGMLVEGIRPKPPGSVDWVPRGGAGGRPLLEWEDAAVTILESYYDAPRVREDTMPDWKNLTREQLAEALKADNPSLAAELNLTEAATPPPASTPPASTPPAPAAAPAGTLTVEELERRLAERDRQWEAKLEEKDQLIEERADELLTERDEARRLEKSAHEMIRKSGLKEGWQADLKRRYSVLPSGPTAALLHVIESTPDGGDVDAALKEAVEADLKHAGELIAEAAGEKRPRVRGLGGDSTLREGETKDKTATTRREPGNTAFRDFLRESGDKFGDKPEDFEKGIREMVQEGVR